MKTLSEEYEDKKLLVELEVLFRSHPDKEEALAFYDLLLRGTSRK